MVFEVEMKDGVDARESADAQMEIDEQKLSLTDQRVQQLSDLVFFQAGTLFSIFTQLPVESVVRCFRVCKFWNNGVNKKALWKALVEEKMIGHKFWNERIGKVPRLDFDALQLLKEFKELIYVDKDGVRTLIGKREDFSVPILIPESIDGVEYDDLDLLVKLVKTPKKGRSVDLEYFEPLVAKTHWKKKSEGSYIMWMTKNTINGTKHKTDSLLETVVRGHDQNEVLTLKEALTGRALALNWENPMYNDGKGEGCWIRVQETVKYKFCTWRVYVGGGASVGLSVDIRYGFNDSGAGGSRKFLGLGH